MQKQSVTSVKRERCLGNKSARLTVVTSAFLSAVKFASITKYCSWFFSRVGHCNNEVIWDRNQVTVHWKVVHWNKVVLKKQKNV